MAASATNSLALSRRLEDVERGDNFNPISGLYIIPLMTLDEALRVAMQDAELRAHMPELQDHLRMINLFCENFSARPPPLPAGVEREPLTREEMRVVQLYTRDTPFYRILNARLRSEERGALQPYLPVLKLLLSAVYKLPQVSGTLFRGVQCDLRESFHPDETKVWWAFSSCTTNLNMLGNSAFAGYHGQRTLLTIQACAAFDVSRYAAFPDEREVVLAPGTTLKVTGIYSPTPDVHHISLVQKTLQPLRLSDDETTELRNRLEQTTRTLHAAFQEIGTLREQAALAGSAEHAALKEKLEAANVEIAELRAQIRARDEAAAVSSKHNELEIIRNRLQHAAEHVTAAATPDDAATALFAPPVDLCEDCGQMASRMLCLDCNQWLCEGCQSQHETMYGDFKHSLVPRDERSVFCAVHPHTKAIAFCMDHRRFCCDKCVDRAAGGGCHEHRSAVQPVGAVAVQAGAAAVAGRHEAAMLERKVADDKKRIADEIANWMGLVKVVDQRCALLRDARHANANAAALLRHLSSLPDLLFLVRKPALMDRAQLARETTQQRLVGDALTNTVLNTDSSVITPPHTLFGESEFKTDMASSHRPVAHSPAANRMVSMPLLKLNPAASFGSLTLSTSSGGDGGASGGGGEGYRSGGDPLRGGARPYVDLARVAAAGERDTGALLGSGAGPIGRPAYLAHDPGAVEYLARLAAGAPRRSIAPSGLAAAAAAVAVAGAAASAADSGGRGGGSGGSNVTGPLFLAHDASRPRRALQGSVGLSFPAVSQLGTPKTPLHTLVARGLSTPSRATAVRPVPDLSSQSQAQARTLALPDASLLTGIGELPNGSLVVTDRGDCAPAWNLFVEGPAVVAKPERMPVDAAEATGVVVLLDGLILVFADCNRVERTGASPWRRTDLEHPYNAAVLDNSVLVTEWNAGTGQVTQLDLQKGTVLKHFGTGLLKYPHGIAVSFLAIFVADEGTQRVHVFDHAGTPLHDFGDGLSRPLGISLDSAGRVYVANNGGQSIAVYDHTGAALANMKLQYCPIGVAVLSTGALAVTRAGPNGLVVFPPAVERGAEEAVHASRTATT